jgi:hypothetical protein
MFCETHLLWSRLDPVPMDSGLCVVRKADAQAVTSAIALMQDFPDRAVALAKACLTTKSAAG